jgi:hypothetical protein
MTSWTDTIEETLNTLKQNTKQLSENYLEKYSSFKNILLYINCPLVILSVLNTYTIFELNEFSRPIQLASAGTSLLIAGLLGGEICFNTQTKLENYLSKHKDFSALSESIERILSLSREERKVDANAFLMRALDDYKKLVVKDEFIEKFEGNLQDLGEQVESIQSYLKDHWNILFRPHFRRIKQKNEKVIEAIKQSGQELQVTLEHIVEPILETTVNPSLQKVEETTTSTSNWLSSLWKSKSYEEAAVTSEADKQESKEKAIELHQVYVGAKPSLEIKRSTSPFNTMRFQTKR